MPASQIGEEKKTSDKKITKLNISREARGKMIAALTNEATDSQDCMSWIFIGIYAVVNTAICIVADRYNTKMTIMQKWRKDYTGITPHKPCKKKMVTIRRRQNDSTHKNPVEETVY